MSGCPERPPEKVWGAGEAWSGSWLEQQHHGRFSAGLLRFLCQRLQLFWHMEVMKFIQPEVKDYALTVRSELYVINNWAAGQSPVGNGGAFARFAPTGIPS